MDEVVKAIKELKSEVKQTVESIVEIPRDIEKEFEKTMSVILSTPIAVATNTLKTTRAFIKESLRAPRYLAEDLRDYPNLLSNFILKSPDEIRQTIREYLTYKKKIRPLNALDILVDILDTILPG